MNKSKISTDIIERGDVDFRMRASSIALKNELIDTVNIDDYLKKNKKI